MKKGFTLIELLAVIVILAIIATIATPIVLNIIKDTKESAVLRSAEYYLSAVEHSIAKKSLSIGESFSPNTCVVQDDGNLLCDGKDELEIEVSGEKPSSGTITFEKGKIVDTFLTLSNKLVVKDENGKLVLGEAQEDIEIVLAPGLYDENNNLLFSWDELVEKYDLKTLIETGWSGEGNNAATIIDSIDGASKLVMGDSVTGIGMGAFYDCTGLTSITIPSSVTSIGDFAFSYCTGLTSITIPDSVTYIGDSAFSYCTGLTSITIPDSVIEILGFAFSGCSGLTSITIPDSVTHISYGAFQACKGLTSITLGSGVTSIDSSAFDGCTGLTSIIVDSNNNTYDSRDNSNAIIETATNTLIAGCKNTVIPSSVTSIDSYAFYGCSGLTSITIPNSVTSIGDEAFSYCTGLTSINYKGTQTNWNAIFKGDCWDEFTPSDKVINYNYVG